MKKIVIIIGTRPELIKLAPVYKAFKKNDRFITQLLTTGQHDGDMIMPLLEFFEIEPDFKLNAMVPNQTLAEFAASLLSLLDGQLARLKPDLVVVQGDTTTCMIASLASFYRKIRIAHVESGLRTSNRLSPYPEEINRRITSLIADFHFAPTEITRQNLLRENVEGQIEVVGNTVIDSLLDAVNRIKMRSEWYQKKYSYLFDKFEKVILVTGHRRENIGKNFQEIYQAIRELAEKYPTFAFVYPVHTNPFVKSLALEVLQSIINIFLLDPLPYNEMIFLMQNSYLVMTDSGGIQEECPALNIPVIVLRDTTERPEGIEAGCSILAGVKKDRIIEVFDQLVNVKKTYDKMSLARNPYGEGNSSERIVNSIERFFKNHDA